MQSILNKQDKQIRFTIEDENVEKYLNFLNLKKNNEERYEFYFYRKPVYTCIPWGIIISVFKGFLAKAAKICSEKYLRGEIGYLTAQFCENGFDQKTLQKMISNFEKKPRNIINNTITTLKKANNTLI